MKTILLSLLVFAQVLMFRNAACAQEGSVQNIFNRLQQYDLLNVVIETDIKQLRTGGPDVKWLPGIFKIMRGKKVDFEMNIQIAARGNMRRKTCDFPPVKIKFYEEKMGNDSLEDINELKMVVSCRNSADDDQLVLKECLTYGLYNIITDESFRVKQASVRFYDAKRKKSGMETVAFFIESEKEMATRLGGRPLKPRIISPKGIDTTAYDRMCLFEFMIGNTDFGAYTRHNVKIVGLKGRQPIAVPYDFDYSGLVAADYAIPSNDLPIQNVQERYYLGLCRDATGMRQLFKEYLDRKKLMFAYCEQFSGLDNDSRRQVINYLKEFFNILEDPRMAQKRILENCNKRIKKDKSDD